MNMMYLDENQANSQKWDYEIVSFQWKACYGTLLTITNNLEDATGVVVASSLYSFWKILDNV